MNCAFFLFKRGGTMGGSASYRLAKKIAGAKLNGASQDELDALERQLQQAKQTEKEKRNIQKQVNAVNKLIDTAIADYDSKQNTVLDYLDAINNRDRNAVLKLDKTHIKTHEKFGDSLDSDEEKATRAQIKEIRKALLDLAGASPDKVTKILNQTKEKIDKRVKENWEKINSLPEETVKQIEHDIENMNIGHYMIGYYGNTLRTMADTLGIPHENVSVFDLNNRLEKALGQRLWKGKMSYR